MSGTKPPPRAGPGRPPGMPNKFTSSIKDAFHKAFEQRGGVDALVAWANDNPDEFYRLASRLIPAEVQAQVTGANAGPVLIKVITSVPQSDEA